MADFPNSVKNFLVLQNGVDKIVAAHPNDRGGEITAIETLIGGLGSAQSNTQSLKNLLLNINKNVHIEFDTVAQSTLKAGEIAIPDASGNVRWRRNTSDLTVTWADIDTGVEANDTYYIYAVADAAGTGFTALISLDDTTPSGAVFFRRIGSFVNSGGDIQKDQIDNDDKDTIQILDFGTSASAFTTKNQKTLKICYGFIAAVPSAGSQAITNLPFTSSTSYQVTTTPAEDKSAIDNTEQVVKNSGAQFTIFNPDGSGTIDIMWIAIGF